jgi:Rod binding domain-containing protein
MNPISLSSSSLAAMSGLSTVLPSNSTLTTNATGPIDQASTNSVQRARLERAAQDFESILLNSLWSSMKEGSLSGEDDTQEDPTGASLSQFGMQMASGAIAKAGGFGIGKMILDKLAPKI